MPEMTPGGRERCRTPRDEIRAELEAHIECREAELITNGASPAAARDEALARFGSLERITMELERMYDRYGNAFRFSQVAGVLGREIQLAFRQLTRNLVPTLGVMMILTLGIGASVVVYSIVDNVLLEPLPYTDADRLVSIRSMDSASTSGAPGALSPPTYRLWRNATSNVETVSAVGRQTLEMQTDQGPTLLNAASVSHTFFGMVGMSPSLGRVFTEEEDQAGGDPVILLSQRLWRSRFGADTSIVGSTIELSGTPTTVVGVASGAVDYPTDVDAWIPLEPQLPENRPGLWGAKYLTVVGKLRAGASPEAAASEFRSLMPDESWAQQIYPELRDLRVAMTGDYTTPLSTLMMAVALVLIVACANVGSILLARGVARQREASIRIAVGASRMRVAVSQVTEAFMLSTVACGAALLVVNLTIKSVVAWAPEALPRSEAISIDTRVAIAAFGTALLTGLLTALGPVVRTLTSRDVLSPLRDGGRTATVSKGTSRALSILVAGELSVTLVLLTAAGLLGRSFYRAVTQDAGYSPQNVISIQLNLPHQRYQTQEARIQFMKELRAQLMAVPGVTEAGLGTTNLPASGFNMRSPLATRDLPGGNPDARVHVMSVTPGFAETVGLRLVSGRLFDDADVDSPRPVVLLSESAARAYFDGRDPVGQETHSFFTRDFAEIVGVVADAKVQTLSTEPTPAIYNLLSNAATSSYAAVIKTELPLDRISQPLREAVWAVDPQLPIAQMESLESILSRSVAQPRFYLLLLGSFAGAALALALIGFYAVITLIVQSRLSEVGIRLALGSTRRQAATLLIKRSSFLAGSGVVIGLALSLVASRFLESVLYDVAPIDPSVMGVSGLFLIVVALLATVAPISKAIRLDPVVVMREN